MTGFGKVTVELPSKIITVEIKSLNSKQLDLSSRISSVYREKEMLIRNELLQALERGKIEIAVNVESIDKESSARINLPVLESFYEQIKTISEKLNIPIPGDWFQTLLRMPEVIKNNMVESDDTEWEVVLSAIREAIGQHIDFRKQEGAKLEKIFEQKIANIDNLLKQVEPFESERIENVKNRITENLKKLPEAEYDSGRFEQELFYYIEKLDINEEKTRLCGHLQYFIETLHDESGQGKKLGFITQEIGREINTLGSKCNHLKKKKIVVRMKDELEQIKEQILNVL
jgi:uncharacterized protein (TIGR00255 family)